MAADADAAADAAAEADSVEAAEDSINKGRINNFH
jgi:hypothetical protein